MYTHLTEEQARKLREALRGHQLEAMITLALVTGMRRDELLRLEWRDIDLEKREVRVRNSKTKSSDWMIHFPEGVTEMLKQHRIRQTEARLEAGLAWQNLDLVFPDRVGGFLRPDHPLKGFHDILEQAELPHLWSHDLRVARWEELRERLRTAKEGLDGAHTGDLDLDQNTPPL